MIKSRRLQSLIFLLCCMFALSTVAHASSVSFNFNSIPLTTSGTGQPCTTAGFKCATDSTVQTTLQGQMPTGASVQVAGALATNDWTADGFIYGGVSASLAGAAGNTYLINANGQEGSTAGNPSTDIIMSFSGLTISSISFTLEIFPDASCPNSGSCTGTNLPDFEFYSGVNTVPTTAVTAPATGNGTVGNVTWKAPTSGFPIYGQSYCTNTTGSNNCAPQQLPESVTISALPTGTNVLDFQDWPATIGISNLTINTPTSVPEPSSLVLLGFGLTGLFTIRRRYAAK